MRKKNLVILIGCLIATALLIGYVVFIRVFLVPTGAMSNTVLPGDRVIGIRSFGGAVERGKVVVVQFPDDPTYYLERVVGLPGETIQFRDRAVYVNGKPLAEERVLVQTRELYAPLTVLRPSEDSGPYRVFYHEDADFEPSDKAVFGVFKPYQIPDGHYFVMGDNRDDCLDSRFRGPVSQQKVWGSVSLIFFSTNMNTGEVRTDRILKSID